MDPYNRLVYTGGNHFTMLPNSNETNVTLERENLLLLTNNIVENIINALKPFDNKDIYKWSAIIAKKYNNIHPSPMFDEKEHYQK
jgi:hypothetical protein